jgi:bifunctional DNA-binding transcriptional regulator/antitoxin component of YhaV-PrlF toxin-antitoxin module
MKIKNRSRLTSKYQVMVPEDVRKVLNLKAGSRLSWHVVKAMVIVDTHKKIEHPVDYISGILHTRFDAVKESKN